MTVATQGQPSVAANPSGAIDVFIGVKLKEQNLAPSSPATRPELIRRVYLDMIGLVPTQDYVGEFSEDDRPDAYARLVDRILASPRYGERCGANRCGRI
jgi:hypothetical protein